jgi:uncharacterized protein (DUF1697 family)
MTHPPRKPATHVALLRGVNVGKAKRVAMADLRALVEELGYGDVRTLRNSGNVAFTRGRGGSALPGPRIEKAIRDRLGVSTRVTVLTSDELAAAIDGNPLLDVADDPSRLLVAVLAEPADRKRLEPLAERDWAPEVLALGPRVAYLWMPAGVLVSQVAKAIDRELGDAQTSRNWATMLALRALTQPAS